MRLKKGLCFKQNILSLEFKINLVLVKKGTHNIMSRQFKSITKNGIFSLLPSTLRFIKHCDKMGLSELFAAKREY